MNYLKKAKNRQKEKKNHLLLQLIATDRVPKLNIVYQREALQNSEIHWFPFYTTVLFLAVCMSEKGEKEKRGGGVIVVLLFLSFSFSHKIQISKDGYSPMDSRRSLAGLILYSTFDFLYSWILLSSQLSLDCCLAYCRLLIQNYYYSGGETLQRASWKEGQQPTSELVSALTGIIFFSYSDQTIFFFFVRLYFQMQFCSRIFRISDNKTKKNFNWLKKFLKEELCFLKVNYIVIIPYLCRLQGQCEYRSMHAEAK